jgi:hypothetical protein
MKSKEKTLMIRRGREAKMRRQFYFGAYLPLLEGFGLRAV